MSTKTLLVGDFKIARAYAERHGLRGPREWECVRDRRQIQGIEGPLRNPASPFRMIYVGGEVSRDFFDAARAQGFTVETEDDALSIEAQVVAAGWWGVFPTGEVTFKRPWIIHERARKGLDDLVEKGYLTLHERNSRVENGPLTWRPTQRMLDEKPGCAVSREFVEANTFPITNDTTKETLTVELPDG